MSIHFDQPRSVASANLFEGEVVDTMYPGCLLERRVKVGRDEVSVHRPSRTDRSAIDGIVVIQPGTTGFA